MKTAFNCLKVLWGALNLNWHIGQPPSILLFYYGIFHNTFRYVIHFKRFELCFNWIPVNAVHCRDWLGFMFEFYSYLGWETQQFTGVSLDDGKKIIQMLVVCNRADKFKLISNKSYGCALNNLSGIQILSIIFCSMMYVWECVCVCVLVFILKLCYIPLELPLFSRVVLRSRKWQLARRNLELI